ncbi:acyltransferase [Serratia marcescens]|nr:acyltransferase [Serratia marcescens]
MRKNLDIEMLRAIAISFILFAHLYNLFPWQSAGLAKAYTYLDLWTGVDLFFFVSGYIIATSLINKLPNETSGREFFKFAVPFWIKRAWRLWPSAWLWLTILLVCSLVFRHSGYWGFPGQNAMYQTYAMLHVANFYGFECRAQYDLPSLLNYACGANQIYWSLSIEEQFYLIFPFAAVFIKRKYLIPFFLVVFAVQFPVNRGGSILGYIRTDAIALGVVIALWARSESYNLLEPRVLRLKRYSIPTIAILLFMLIELGNSRIAAISFSTGLIAVVAGILVWVASFDRNYLTFTPILKKIASYIGSRSYTIYLAHIPVYFLTKEVWWRYLPEGFHPDGSYTLRYIITAIIILVVVTEASYRLIEIPLRNKGRHISKKFQ